MLLPWNQSEIVPSLSRQCPRGASLSLNQVTTWSRVLGLVPGSKTDDRRTRGLEGLVLPGWMGFRVCLFLSHFIFCSNSFFLSSGIPSKICRSSILGSCVHRHTIGEMETLTTAQPYCWREEMESIIAHTNRWRTENANCKQSFNWRT